MMNALVFAFILISLAIGYGLGRYSFFRKNTPFNKRYSTYSKSYFESLTFLLNEETDEAIDRFIADMDVNEETLEVHLSLGALLRRKGELARAVRVHENLLSKDLQDKTRELVQLELAQDYIQSGVLDRAENLLKSIIDKNPVDIKLRRSALDKLIDVYQNTSEWLLAIDVADQLTSNKFEDKSDQWKVAQAQFSCELAELALNKNDDTEALKWTRAALRYNSKCARASLLQARIELRDGAELNASATLKDVMEQNIEFTSEIVDPLESISRKLNTLPEFINTLSAYLQKEQNAHVLSMLFTISIEKEGFAKAVERIKHFLPNYSNLSPALSLVEAIDSSECNTLEKSLRPALESLLNEEKRYECQRCGFRGNEMHWLCPSCKTWESVKQR